MPVDAVPRRRGLSECRVGTGTVTTRADTALSVARMLRIVRNAGVRDREHQRRAFAQVRDTFAVERLLAGVPLETVSLVLGHSSASLVRRRHRRRPISRAEHAIGSPDTTRAVAHRAT